MAYVACASFVPGCGSRINIDDLGASASMYFPTRDGRALHRITLPVSKNVLLARVNDFIVTPPHSRMLPTTLLRPTALLANSDRQREEKIVQIVNAIIRTLPLFPSSMRLDTVRTLPAAILDTQRDGEEYFSDTRFRLFLRALSEPTLANELGAEEFIGNLNDASSLLNEVQIQRITKAIAGHLHEYDKPAFLSAAKAWLDKYQAPVTLYVDAEAGAPEGKGD
jgi:hypothetical protein